MEDLMSLCKRSIVPTDQKYFRGPSTLSGTCSGKLPFYTINENEEGLLTIDFKEDDIRSSTVKSEYFVNKFSHNLKNFVHNFTFEFLCSSTDEKLGNYFPNLDPRYAVLTPDAIMLDGQTMYVVEFATNASSSRDSLNRTYQSKILKYEPALKEAMESDNSNNYHKISHLYFFIIAVNRLEILSNLTFEDKGKDAGQVQIAYRFAIALDVMREMILEGFVQGGDAELSTEEFKTLQWVRGIKIKDRPDNDEFSYQNYQMCLEAYDNKNVCSVVRKSFALAKKMVITNRRVPDNLGKSIGLQVEIEQELEKYLDASKKMHPEGSRSNLKSIVNVPLMSVRQTSASLSLESSKLQQYIGSSNDPTFLAWESAKSNYYSNSERFQMDVESDIYSQIDKDEVSQIISSINSLTPLDSNPKGLKTMYHRTPVEIPESVQVYLACLGVNGKSMKDNPTVKTHKAERHKPFDFFTDTSDIEKFLSDPNLSEFFEGKYCRKETLKNELELINEAIAAHGMTKLTRDYSGFLNQITETMLFSWAKLISDIATEISISMKQHCKKNEYIIKKLKDFNVFLLIKPTKSSEQCFFSILVFNEDLIEIKTSQGNIFRQWLSNKHVSWTEFVSVNQSKLVNWNLLESRVMALIPYWLEFHGNEPFLLTLAQLPEDLRENKNYVNPIIESYKMIWFSILVSLADKAEIEETLSLSRFMVMEAFVTYPLLPRPHKMIEKFTTNIRSRLTIYIMNKLLKLCSKIIRGDIQGESEGIPDSGVSFTTTETIYKWKGLTNWITGYPLSNPGQVINLMYLGYIKNKNENTEINAESKLLNKILTLEEKLTPEIRARIGRVNKEFNSGTYHEYNLDLMKYACEHIKNKYKTKMDPDSFTNQVSRTFLEKISSTSVESVFTTLKASSNFDESYFIYADYYARFNQDHKERAARANKEFQETGKSDDLVSENFKRVHAYYRSKIIEKCIPYVEGDKIMVRDILPICLEEVTKNDYMRICIFKKQQHGGLREIYVLNFAERVLQYFIETAGRVLCEMFPGETMTHPDNKKRIPESHARDVRTYFSRGATYTTFTSADSAKWNQNQYCHKFALMMVNLYSEDWHGIMWEILQLWRNKYIKISDGLLHKFHSTDGQFFHDDVTKKMYRGYKDFEQVPWIQKGRSYIVTRSGMMQGILHYVSSAFHSLINSCIETLINTRIKNNLPDARSSCSTIQSSDDSGMILTINHTDSSEINKRRILCWMASMHYFKCVLSEEVAIKNSIKTTFHCSRVFEFNSKFYFANFHYEPDIKLAFASVLISQQENFIERQEELYTLLTSYITTGGSFYSAFFIQCSQALLYYRGLGSSVTTKFSLLTACQNYLRDPSSGFFLMDNVLCPGLPGFSYNLWVSLQSGRLSEAYNDQLEMQTKNNESLIETTSLGHIIRKAFISFGSTKKLEQMKRRMGLSSSWADELDANPALLFRDAKTTEEFKTKIGLKLSQRGVSTSLATGVPITSVIASSVYLLSSAVFKVREAEQGLIEKTKYKGEQVKRASLFPLILKTITIQGKPLTKERMRILFHKNDEYQAFYDKLKTYNKAVTTKKLIEKRRVVTTLSIFKDDSSASISKYQLLKMVWFRDECVRSPLYPQRLVMEVFNKLRENISWLSSDFKESLEKSPFTHAHQMVNWFKQLDSRTKVVCLLGAPLSTKRGKSTVGAAITSNFGRFHKLTVESDGVIPLTSSSMEDVLHNLVALSTLPFTQRDALAKEIVTRIPDSVVFDSSKIKSRHNSLITMRDAINQRVDRITLFNQIASNQVGYVGAWTVRQAFNTATNIYEGTGVWDGVVNGVLVHIEVESYPKNPHELNVGTQMSEITVREWNLDATSDFEQGMKQWVRDSHVSPNLSHHNLKDFKGREVLAFFTDRVSNNPSGTPIFLSKTPNQMLRNIESHKYYSVVLPSYKDVANGKPVRLRLISKTDPMVSTGKTLLSVQLYSTDWRADCDREIPSFRHVISTAYLKNEPLNVTEAMTQIGRNSGPTELRQLMVTNLRSWLFEKGLREGVKRHPTVLGTGGNLIIQPDIEEPLDLQSECSESDGEDIEFGDDWLTNLVEDATKDIVFDCDIDPNELDPLGLLDMDTELINEDDFAFHMEADDKIYRTISHNNRLMSELADKMVEIMPILAMNEVIKSETYTSNYETVMPVLRWLFPEKTFRLNSAGLLEMPVDRGEGGLDDFF